MTKAELLNFIADMFNVPECNSMVTLQVHKYITECGYTPLEIARALSFFVDVQKRTPEYKYGIGIVPHVMKEAKAYFYKLEKQKQEQAKAADKALLAETEAVKCIAPVANTIRRKSIDISKLF